MNITSFELSKTKKVKIKECFLSFMKNITPLLIVLLVAILPTAGAVKGVGIRYTGEHTTFVAGQVNCLTYRVYNPWDEDVAIELTAGGDLSPFIHGTEEVLVQAHTKSSSAIPLDICFAIPRASSEECPQIKYEGEVIAREAHKDRIFSTGSSTSVVASAPLSVSLNCETKLDGAAIFGSVLSDFGSLDFLFLVIGMIALLSLAVFTVSYQKSPAKKRKAYQKFYHQLLQLQQELKYDPFNQDKQYKYNTIYKKFMELQAKLDK